MNKVLLASCGLVLLSCSHFEPVAKTAQFPYAPELLQSVQTANVARKPASLKAENLDEKSPGRVYFSSLYYQYLTLSQYLHSDSKIESCPAFHHDKIETEERQVSKVTLYKASHIDLAGKNYFPELAFNKQFSLSDHFEGLHQELATLCEEGISDNYYKFDNLVTYYADKKDFHTRPGAMAAVLKIPVFANYYLVKMLDARNGVIENHPEETRFIRMTQTHWFGHYVARAHEQRDQFIKNKLVTR